MTKPNIGDLNTAIYNVLSSCPEVDRAYLNRLSGHLAKKVYLVAEWARRNHDASNKDIEDRLTSTFLGYLAATIAVPYGVLDGLARDLVDAVCRTSRQRLFED